MSLKNSKGKQVVALVIVALFLLALFMYGRRGEPEVKNPCAFLAPNKAMTEQTCQAEKTGTSAVR